MCSSDQASARKTRRRISLGNLVTSYWSGYSFRSSDYTDAGIPVLTKGDIKPRGSVQHGGRFVEEAMLASKRVRTTNANDFLVSTRDLTTAADFLGLVSKAPRARAFAVNQGVTVFQVDENQVDRSFLAYWCEGPEFRGYVKGHFSGATQIHIRHHDLMAAPVSLPDIAEQRRIASLLSAYDDLIENNTQRISILEEMARHIYEEWFVRFRFPGHDSVQMVESELGLVPEGWLFRPLGAVVDEVRDAIDPTAIEADTPYVGLEHIPRRSIALAEWGKAADVQSTKLRFREWDILFGKIRPYFHKVAVAPLSGVASSDAIVIRPKRGEDFGLTLAVVSSDAFVAHATQTSNGTKMPRANWNVLARYPVPTPPTELRARFEDLMESVVSAVSNHTLRNRNLRATRDLLLPKLISGELDVSKLPEPESA